ncbi:MAG: hypothetical protein R3B82_27850 [Sandaracinaceae bacterium]
MDAMVDCLVEARGGTVAEQRRYLENVLVRSGVDQDPEWADLYRCLTLLQKDALDEGAEPRLVQEHVTRLHRILSRSTTDPTGNVRAEHVRDLPARSAGVGRR